MISISAPFIDESEIQSVSEVLRSTNIAQGNKCNEFEELFNEKFGYSYSIALNNGTTALHVALLSCGVKPGDKVLTTPFSFVATTNSILYCDAIPVFADIDPVSFNISPESIRVQLEKQPDIKFLLIVHTFGKPCQMDEILKIVEEYNITLIEDCAQAHGAQFQNQPVGSFGAAGIFSFYPTKNMTTGEGGMLVTNSESIAVKARLFRNHGMKSRYEYVQLGYNYRLNDIAAAIGISQLNKLEQMNNRREENAKYYRDNINNKYINLPKKDENFVSINHQFSITTNHKKELMELLEKKQIGYGVYYPSPLYSIPHIREYLERFDQAVNPLENVENTCNSIISIPIHPMLTIKQLSFITDVINSFCPIGGEETCVMK